MDRYSALIRYEWRSLRWVLLYFLLVTVGGVGALSYTMKVKALDFKKHMGVWEIQTLFSGEMNWIYGFMMCGLVVGLLILAYVQFRDAKSIEVGRFLKVLPIKSTGVYWTRVGCGILTYTVPFVLFCIGSIAIRLYNNDWLMDYYRLSPGYSTLVKIESVPSILGNLGMMYLVLTVMYIGFLLMQYLVSNRIFALVMGVILFMVPPYLMVILSYGWKGYSDFPYFGLIPMYGYREEVRFEQFANGEALILRYIEHQELKGLILLGLIGGMLVIGYSISRAFRVEDQGRLIPMKGARMIFIAVGTVCMSLLPYMLWIVGITSERDLGIGAMYGLIAVCGLVGYWIIRKIAMIGMKGY